jgi:hypothetical protein
MTPDVYDGPWKAALEVFFPEFLAFFFPEAHQGIDWSRGYVFLDKELQHITPEAEIGTRSVDKLVQVWRHEGAETWVLIHIEVQTQADPDFARRMFVYHYRLFDRYDRQVVSLAVLGDDQAAWQPSVYTHALWGSRLELTFPIAKLLEFEGRWEDLSHSRNPFAIVVRAHLKTLVTRKKPDQRLIWKLTLVKELYKEGWMREQVFNLFRFIDWLMALPEALQQRFDQDLTRFDEETRMEFITSFERRGIEQGREEGREEGMRRSTCEAVLEILTVRFGGIPDEVAQALDRIEDPSLLKGLLRTALTSPSLDAFRQALPGSPA